MIIGFSWWSMYEESKKNNKHIDFKNELLEWSAEGNDSISSKFSGDTLQIAVLSPSLLWYDRIFEKTDIIKFSVKETENNNNYIWGCIWAVNDSPKLQSAKYRFFPFSYDNCYMLSYSAGKFYFSKQPENYVDSFSLFLDKNDTFSIELKHETNKINVFINNKNIFVYEDSSKLRPNGKFGIFLQNGGLQLSGLTFSRTPHKNQ